MNARNPPQSPDPYLHHDADADGSTKAPLLSVVIPVYNEEGILASSIIAPTSASSAAASCAKLSITK